MLDDIPEKLPWGVLQPRDSRNRMSRPDAHWTGIGTHLHDKDDFSRGIDNLVPGAVDRDTRSEVSWVTIASRRTKDERTS